MGFPLGSVQVMIAAWPVAAIFIRIDPQFLFTSRGLALVRPLA